MNMVYLITGASSDVGMQYITKLEKECDDKITVYAFYRTETERFRDLTEGCNKLEIIPVNIDLSDSERRQSVLSGLVEEGVCPTHIVHLAADKFDYMKIKYWDYERVRNEMEISFYAFADICKAFVPGMAKRHTGRIVAMLTSYTLGTPPKYMSDYIACKYALMGFVKAAAAEYADKGITINAVSPNMMETKFLDGIDNRIVEMTAQNCAMKRNIQVDETVEAIDFLMSDKASYINGVNLNLSGGDYM